MANDLSGGPLGLTDPEEMRVVDEVRRLARKLWRDYPSQGRWAEELDRLATRIREEHHQHA